MIYRLAFILIFFMSMGVYAQVSGMAYQQLLNPNIQNGSHRDKLVQVQAAFIQELFVKQLFNTPEFIEFDEDPIYDTRESNELMNTLYAREVSRMLAEQDLLNLNRLFIE